MAGEAAQHLVRAGHVQARDDLAPDGGRGRGRAGDEARRTEALDEIADLQVVGPEVVAPVADAVRLVDGEQRERELREHAFDEGFRREALRRDVEQLHLAGEHHVDAAAVLFGVEVRGEVRRRDAARGERRDLVGHERDERRDHDGDARQIDGGLLEAHALAAARRRDDEHLPVAFHERIDGFALPVVELHHSPFASTGVHLFLPSGVRVM